MTDINLSNRDFRRINLPYCIDKLDVALPHWSRLRPHIWLPLNRLYKPLGIASRDWVDYEDHLDKAIVFARDPRTFANIWADPDDGKGGLYLYSDSCRDWADYLLRLGRLFSHKHSYYVHSQARVDRETEADIARMFSAFERRPAE
jgi:hypothetical protein